MIPVKQSIKHDPENGQYGDCHRAAIASVLGMPLDEVPHFLHDDCPAEVFVERERDFLEGHGLVPISLVFRGDLDDILNTIGALNGPNIVYLVGGTSPRGVHHTVVARGNQLVHDPSPSDGFLVGPCADGAWWITFFGARSVNRKARP